MALSMHLSRVLYISKLPLVKSKVFRGAAVRCGATFMSRQQDDMMGKYMEVIYWYI